MSLLSHDQLMELVDRGVITNVQPEFVNAASIDLTLGAMVMRELVNKNVDSPVVSLSRKEKLEMTKVDLTHDTFYLHPGQFILACTEQEFNLPNNISAEYKLKSSMARIGLEHLNAGWCDAGWNGSVLTLELKNMTTDHIIELRKGDRIGQIVFFQHAPVADKDSYAARGRYNGDKSVSGAKE